MTHPPPSLIDLSDRDLRQRDLIPRDQLTSCRITVIGVGAIGRQVAVQLAAIGATRIELVDHDRVEIVNLAPQGYFPRDIGVLKVEATASLLRQINPEVELQLVPERFRRSRKQECNVAFVCVDSIETRKSIWNSLKNSVEFFCDGRMSAQSLRVLTAADAKGKTHYPSTLFASGDAFQGSCTAKSTVYCATIAAGFMVNSFTHWLRGIPIASDLTLNLLSAELTVHQ